MTNIKILLYEDNTPTYKFIVKGATYSAVHSSLLNMGYGVDGFSLSVTNDVTGDLTFNGVSGLEIVLGGASEEKRFYQKKQVPIMRGEK